MDSGTSRESEPEVKFVAFVGTEGRTPADKVAEMNRDWPAYATELERRGLAGIGRELELPEEGVATVRVRDGETLVSDGPFLETKEFVGGFDLFDADDMDSAVERESGNPVLRYHPFEIRPLAYDFRVTDRTEAFGAMDDADGVPHLLAAWVEGPSAAVADDLLLRQECDAWRQENETRGVFVLGGVLGPPDAARTLRTREREIQLTAGPFIDGPAYLAAIDVVRTPALREAMDLAASHPFARLHAVEVRPFYTEAAHAPAPPAA